MTEIRKRKGDRGGSRYTGFSHLLFKGGRYFWRFSGSFFSLAHDFDFCLGLEFYLNSSEMGSDFFGKVMTQL